MSLEVWVFLTCTQKYCLLLLWYARFLFAHRDAQVCYIFDNFPLRGFLCCWASAWIVRCEQKIPNNNLGVCGCTFCPCFCSSIRSIYKYGHSESCPVWYAPLHASAKQSAVENLWNVSTQSSFAQLNTAHSLVSLKQIHFYLSHSFIIWRWPCAVADSSYCLPTCHQLLPDYLHRKVDPLTSRQMPPLFRPLLWDFSGIFFPSNHSREATF